ncbi:MAG: hypothetical protein R3C28_16105 [Pirellulaceae bacterium]
MTELIPRMVAVTCFILGEFAITALAGQNASTPNQDAVAIERQQQIESLVTQLGSRSFAERRLATEQLVLFGLDAQDALRKAIESADYEVRMRGEMALRRIRQQQRFRLIARLTEGGDAKQLNLPGWSEFVTLVGDSTEARSLFGEMLRRMGFLDEVFFAKNTSLPKLLTERCEQLTHQRRQFGAGYSAGNLTALLFVSVAQDTDGQPLPGELIRLMFDNEFRAAVNGGPHRAALMKLLGKLVSSNFDMPTSWASTRLILAMQYDVPEGVELAKQIASQNDSSPTILQWALLAIGKLGKPEDLHVLTQKLTDDTVVGMPRNRRNVGFSTQIRDVALACLIQRSGESLKDYGLRQAIADPNAFLRLTTIGFASDEEREQAINRWQQRHKSE